MKRRLFWKILIGFWLTLFAITQIVWLLFEISHNERPGLSRTYQVEIASRIMAAGSKQLEAGGPDAVRTFSKGLPRPQQDRLKVEPVTDKAAPAEAPFERDVAAPDGSVYRLTYREPAFSGPPLLPRAPPELVIGGLVGGLLFSAVLAWYLTEPINRLRRGFDRLAHGDLDVRLASETGRRRDEIADLGRDFDTMAQRLQSLVASRERLLHDLSHELRSPLARLHLAIGLARRGKGEDSAQIAYERIEREVERLELLVGEVLALARAEHAGAAKEDYFDLAGVVDSVTDDAQFEAAAASVEICQTATMPEGAEYPLLVGNAELVRRAIDNVIRNALRYAPPGSAVQVTLNYRPELGSYDVTIADRGPGVLEHEIATMFDPFVRGVQSQSGLGLGLSIASRAVSAHGGTITARNRTSGGLSVRMTFPVTA